jgi:2-hydroxy-6-oxonona-2,4-dienedioate hydrolase
VPTHSSNQPKEPAQLDELERRARRYQTPCAEGSIVWRSWGSGRPVLLMHGSHGFWGHWIRNIDALAARRTVWVLDLPGYGDSALPTDGSHEGIAAAIASGLRQLMPHDLPIDIAAFSFGAVIAAHLGVFHPDLVRRVILVDGIGMGTPLGDIKLQKVRGLPPAERKAVNRANLLELMLHHPDSVDELALAIQASGAARSRLNPVPLTMPQQLIDAVPRLTAHVDAIWGEHDRVYPNPSAQERALRQFHPRMDFRVIAGAGHWAMYEQADEFNRVLLELLSSGR